MASIHFDSGPRKGDTIILNKRKSVFGRKKDADGVLNHPTVSREHFFIERSGEKFLAVDPGSGNGTFVNGERISWVEIRPGDKIQAGPFVMSFSLQNMPQATLPEEEIADAPTLSPEQQEAADVAMCGPEQGKFYPREYLEGIRLFNERRYFEAHEAWEEVWLRSVDPTKLFYQMLIQAAVALHHYERGNYRGSRGVYQGVMEKLARLPAACMSIDLVYFRGQFQSFFAELIEQAVEQVPPGDKARPKIDLIAEEHH